MNKESIKSLIDQVESQSLDNDKLMQEITKDYTEQFDNLIEEIRSSLVSTDGDLPIDTLAKYTIELCPAAIFTLAGVEKLGNRADVAESFRKEKYNSERQKAIGTANDKTSIAENKTIEEQLVSDLYSRCYKSVKVRGDWAKDTVDALKKALSAKMLEMQLMKTQSSLSTNM